MNDDLQPSAEAQLQPELAKLVQSEDAAIGIQAFLSRTEAKFIGK